LSALIDDSHAEHSVFPAATVRLEGFLEDEALISASDMEAAFRSDERARRDAAAGRTLSGPHRMDLVVHHRAKAMPAALSSTGEQKALLIGIVLGHAQLVRAMTGHAPILLLDEIAAHLDEGRRAALFDLIEALDCQAFMTGTDVSMFASLGRGGRCSRSDGKVTPTGTPLPAGRRRTDAWGHPESRHGRDPSQSRRVARYARHIVLAEIGGAGQQRLKAARVLVIGAGGLGSPVLSYLAAAGVGLLGVIDDDEVSLSNLQRQILHDTANVGMAKTESAARRSSGSTRTPGWSPTDAADAGQCGGHLTAYDMVVDGSDNFDTRYLLADTCEALKSRW
jgi:hypothetical protein